MVSLVNYDSLLTEVTEILCKMTQEISEGDRSKYFISDSIDQIHLTISRDGDDYQTSIYIEFPTTIADYIKLARTSVEKEITIYNNEVSLTLPPYPSETYQDNILADILHDGLTRKLMIGVNGNKRVCADYLLRYSGDTLMCRLIFSLTDDVRKVSFTRTAFLMEAVLQVLLEKNISLSKYLLFTEQQLKKYLDLNSSQLICGFVYG